MATVYGSSPDAQPADQTRSGASLAFSSSSRGMTSSATTSHVSASRKKPVTLIRIVLKSSANSSGCSARWA
jgi:hypothetical protein